MGKGKLAKFREIEVFGNVFQPPFSEVFKNDFYLKNNWKNKVFNNIKPVILELGCGKGEYTMGLAKKYPDKNFIGVDIKGARIWKGAKEACLNNIKNVAFLRTRIEIINSFFGEDEVDEIWITFPDPQIKKRRSKKRLTSAGFLGSYQRFIVDGGIIHLKTDSCELYEYTMKILTHNKIEIIYNTSDLYGTGFDDDELGIKTFYEQMFLKEGKPITYIKFKLAKNIKIEGPDEDQ